MTRSSFVCALGLALFAGACSPSGKADLSPGGPDGSTSGGGDLAPQSACQPGHGHLCYCLNGGQGTQFCRDDGTGYDTCIGCMVDGGGGEVTVSDMQLGNPCGACDGCCNGTTCVPYASQSNGECGGSGTSCSSCASGTVCDGATGACVTATNGCDDCGNGCCGKAADGSPTCFVDNAGNCGTGDGVCMACEHGTLCSDGVCNNKIDPSANFVVEVLSVQVYNTDDMGDCWDNYAGFGCAQPDLQVCFGYDAGNNVLISACTTVLSDVPVDNGADPSSATATDTGSWPSPAGIIKDGNGQYFYIPGSAFIAGKVLIYVQDYDSLNANDIIGATYVTTDTLYPGYSFTHPPGRVVSLNWTMAN